MYIETVQSEMKANRTEGELEIQPMLGSLLAVKATQCNHGNWFVCLMECAINYSLLDQLDKLKKNWTKGFGTTAFSILDEI